jgi:cytochrome c oxidase assembly protein subunit 11
MNHHRTLIPLISIVVGMMMLAYASAPLYRMFCAATGFGGTTREAAGNATRISDRRITVRFDTTTDPHLPWIFKPVEPQVTVRFGENRLVAFTATNTSDMPTLGHATYNVTPFAAGRYFNKIQCFCFKQQPLGPHQQVQMPVSFFVDPAMRDDPQLRDVTNITLSYTFFSYDSANHSK